MRWDAMAVVGVIARAHGNRGEVIVNPETDFPEERFKPGSVVYIVRGDETIPLRVDGLRLHKGRPVLALAGVTTMDAADAVAGLELRVPRDELQELAAGVFYHHDLVGCAVETVGGAEVGRVTAVERESGGDRLVVRARRGEVLVPFNAAICVEIDAQARRIVIDPPEGLIELNQRP